MIDMRIPAKKLGSACEAQKKEKAIALGKALREVSRSCYKKVEFKKVCEEQNFVVKWRLND